MIDTRSHMIAGYVVATVIYLVYIGSLIVRDRRLRTRIAESHEQRR